MIRPEETTKLASRFWVFDWRIFVVVDSGPFDPVFDDRIRDFMTLARVKALFQFREALGSGYWVCLFRVEIRSVCVRRDSTASPLVPFSSRVRIY